MARKLSIPIALMLGLLTALTALVTPGKELQAYAHHPAPVSIRPAAIVAQEQISATLPVSTTTLTPVDVQPAVPVTVTVIVTVTAEPDLVATPAPVSQLPVVDLLPNEVLTGTIVTNRTEANIFFFLDNDLYQLPANRATGLILSRPLAGLTLFTCAAEVVDDPACQWNAYPIRRSALYEIGVDASLPEPANLGMSIAAAPPLDAAIVQNRTGADSTLLWGEEEIEIGNTAVISLGVAEAAGNALYLPHCLETGSQQICEWLPTSLTGGVYYALRETSNPTAINGVTILHRVLDPLLMQEALMTPTPAPTPEPQGLFCQAQIPSLNVRSGPGTEFLVVGKLRTSDANRGRVLVVGRSEETDWLAVDPRFVEGGWVVNVPEWITCEPGLDTLPVTGIIDGRTAPPTPVPAPAPASAENPAQEEANGEPLSENGALSAESSELGLEQARLIATNSFDHPVRFTLDAALHGLPEGTPSEHDLEPGQSMRFIIRAGRVQFSASTAWRDGAGNAEFTLGEGATRELFLRFEPSLNDPDKWELRFE